MNNYNSEIEQLIIKSIRGQITEYEKHKLNKWLEEKSENEAFYKRVSTGKNIINKVSDYNSIDLNAAIIRNKSLIRKRASRKRFITALPYAAAIIGIIIAIPFIIPQKQKEEIVKTEIIQAGSKKAELILANGEVIGLGDTKPQKIIQSDGSVIEITDKRVEYKESSAKEKLTYNTIRTPRGGEYSLKLSDGTMVWINSDSELKHPVHFVGDKRIVEVKGEAYFDVRKDKDRPFIIKTSRGDIKVLGTSFNVRDYKEEQALYTTLVEGKVELSNRSNNVILTPGKQAIVKGMEKIVVNEVDTEIYTSWKDGRFVFKRQTMEEIMNNLSRWYDVDVFFEDNEARNIEFSGNLKRYEDFEKIIEMIELMKKVRFKIKGRTIWVMKI